MWRFFILVLFAATCVQTYDWLYVLTGGNSYDLKALFNITVIAEWCCFIAALILLRRGTGLWRLFILFLFITILAETGGWYLWNVVGQRNNSWVFNINLIINVCFSGWMLTTADPLKKVKFKVVFLISCFFIFAVWNVFFFQGFWRYNAMTEAIGDILLAVISCYFFYSLLKEETFRNLFRYEYYWFANGLLFYSLGAVILYLFVNDLWEYYKHTGINVYGYINYTINVLLYGSLTIAFICRHINTR